MPLLTGSHKLQPGTFRAFVMNEAKFSFVKKHYIRSKCPLKHFYRKFFMKKHNFQFMVVSTEVVSPRLWFYRNQLAQEVFSLQD